MLALLRPMLDRKNDDLVSRVIDSVIDEIGVAACYHLAYTIYLLFPSEMWKNDQILQDSRIAFRTRNAACGLCSRM
jgi:hypothetical protein